MKKNESALSVHFELLKAPKISRRSLKAGPSLKYTYTDVSIMLISSLIVNRHLSAPGNVNYAYYQLYKYKFGTE